MSGVVKLDVKVGVNRSWKLGSYFSNEVNAVRFLYKEIVITLAVWEPSIIEVDIRAIWKDRKARRPRMEGYVGMILGRWVKANPIAWSGVAGRPCIYILSFLPFLTP